MMHKLSLIACDLVMMVIIEIKEVQLCGTNGTGCSRYGSIRKR